MIAMLVVLANVLQPSNGLDELRCILDAVPAADQERLGRASLTATAHDPAAQRRLSEAAATCATRFSLPPQQATAFGNLAYVTFVMRTARTMLAAQNVDIAHVDAWFDALDPAAQTSSNMEELSADRLAAELSRRGAAREAIRGAAPVIVRYIRVRTALARMQRGLPLR